MAEIIERDTCVPARAAPKAMLRSADHVHPLAEMRFGCRVTLQ